MATRLFKLATLMLLFGMNAFANEEMTSFVAEERPESTVATQPITNQAEPATPAIGTTAPATSEELEALKPEELNRGQRKELKDFYKSNKLLFESLDLKLAYKIINTISEDHDEPGMSLAQGINGAEFWISEFNAYPSRLKKYRAAVAGFEARVAKLRAKVNELADKQIRNEASWPLTLSLAKAPSNEVKTIEVAGIEKTQRRITYTQRTTEEPIPPVRSYNELRNLLALEEESLQQAQEILQELIYSHAAHTMHLRTLREKLKNDFALVYPGADEDIAQRHQLFHKVAEALEPQRLNADEYKPDPVAEERVNQAFHTERLLEHHVFKNVKRHWHFFNDRFRAFGAWYDDWFSNRTQGVLAIAAFSTLIYTSLVGPYVVTPVWNRVVASYENVTLSEEQQEALKFHKLLYDYFWKITVEWKAQEPEKFTRHFVEHSHQYFHNRAIEIWLTRKKAEYATGAVPNFKAPTPDDQWLYDMAQKMDRIWNGLLKGAKSPVPSAIDDIPPLAEKFDEMNRINKSVDELLKDVKERGLERSLQSHYRWGELGSVAPSAPANIPLASKPADCTDAVTAATTQPAKP